MIAAECIRLDRYLHCEALWESQIYGSVSDSDFLCGSSALLLCHEHNSKNFVDTTETASINLAEVYRSCLEQLFEHDSVVAHLSRRNSYSIWFERFTDLGVAQNIVWRCRFFDESGAHSLAIFPLFDESFLAHVGLNSARCFIHSMAVGTPQT